MNRLSLYKLAWFIVKVCTSSIDPFKSGQISWNFWNTPKYPRFITIKRTKLDNRQTKRVRCVNRHFTRKFQLTKSWCHWVKRDSEKKFALFRRIRRTNSHNCWWHIYVHIYIDSYQEAKWQGSNPEETSGLQSYMPFQRYNSSIVSVTWYRQSYPFLSFVFYE